jgi:hypothetical protein
MDDRFGRLLVMTAGQVLERTLRCGRLARTFTGTG